MMPRAALEKMMMTMLVMMMMLMMMTMQISRPLGHTMPRAALKKKMLMMTTMIMSRPPGHMMPMAEYDDNDVEYRQQQNDKKSDL